MAEEHMTTGMPSGDASERRLKVYSPSQVAGATFLGSPIAGSILLASNFAAFGRPQASRQALLLGAVSTILILVLALVLPKNFPNAVLPAAYTAAIHAVAKHTQGGLFEAYRAAGGVKHSHWRVVALGVACLIVVIVVLMAVLMLLPPDWLGEAGA